MTCYGGFFNASGLGITVSGGLTFGNFAICSRGGNMSCFSNSYSTNVATGTRYYCDCNGFIFTNLGGATYLPGDTTGVTGSGGIYV